MKPRLLKPRRLTRRPRFAPVDLPTVQPARPNLTVAVILDPFSELAFRYEWKQVTFGPDDWREVLSQERPDLLFVESAWQSWRLHMTREDMNGRAHPSEELRALVEWCHAEAIPTVFWNKEDPPNYGRFLETARLFQQVFTVDADRIPDYQRDLGHDRVDLLPFAAQPRIHNPVRRAPKAHDVAFAGTWFAAKHPERREQMEFVLGPALGRGLHIWSRMQPRRGRGGDKRYRFPKPFRKYVVGSLPYDRMLAAYTSYEVFLNVNSVTRSKTMCSRRLFELSAAQTAVISAPAASIEPFFGPTIEVVENAEQTARALDVLLTNAEYRDRLALQAHRRVFDEHLCTHRVDAVLRSVGLVSAGLAGTSRDEQGVSVIVPTKRPEQLDHVLRTIGKQSHRDIELVLVTHGFTIDEAEVLARAAGAGVPHITIVPADAELTLGACMNLGVQAATRRLVAKVDDDNFYGTHYLTDLVRALGYSGADVVGKWAHLVHLESSGATLLRFGHAEHRFVEQVQGGTLLMRRTLAEQIRFDDLPRRVDTSFLAKVRAAGLTVYAADRFNFVSVRRADTGSHTWPISDKEIMARSSRLLFYGDPIEHAEA